MASRKALTAENRISIRWSVIFSLSFLQKSRKKNTFFKWARVRMMKIVLQQFTIPKLKKNMTFFFLIRLCDLCPERKRGRKVSRICKKTMLQWAWNRIWRICHLQNMPIIILVTFSFYNLWNLIWLIRKNIKKHNLNNSINSLKSPPELIVKNCYKILILICSLSVKWDEDSKNMLGSVLAQLERS